MVLLQKTLRMADLTQPMEENKASRKSCNELTISYAPLPKGYDTVLDDELSGISAGQKQLLTIARVILTDPSILILDEATSSVDTRTEVEIQKAMNSLMQNRTSFVIAHRLSTIRDADVILVMRNGTIVEQGNHEYLMGAKRLLRRPL